MTTKSSTTRTRAIALLLLALAILVPWYALTSVGVRQFQSWPAAAIPFGLNRMLFCHLVAALPLALWCGWKIPRAADRWSIIVGLAAVGLLVAGVSWLVADALAPWFLQTDWLLNFVSRTIWAFLLVLPWCLAASILFQRIATSVVPHWTDGLTAFLFLSVPYVYGLSELDRYQQIVGDALTNQQYGRALQMTQRLSVLGVSRLGQTPIAQLLADLQHDVDLIRQELALPLPQNANAEQRYQRAFQHYRLGDFAAARRLLSTLSESNPRAPWLLALSAEAAGDWGDAAGYYRATLQLLGNDPAAELAFMLRGSVERLANNLRRLGQHSEAEHELKEAIERWPDHRDRFLLQLGEHYQMAGRLQDAQVYFDKAIEANPELDGQIELRMSKLQREPQGCLLRPARGATR